MLQIGREAPSLIFSLLGLVRYGRSSAMLTELFQITHNFKAFGQNCANVYHALRANAGEMAININDAFAFTIVPIYQLLMTTKYTNTNLVCFNLGNPLDFHTQDLLAITGARTGPDSPSFVSAGVRFPTLNRDVRSGQKRFAGLKEDDYNEGVMGAPVLTLVQNLSDALIGNWLASADSHIVANYVVIQRVCDLLDPVTGKCLKYRLPEPPETGVFFQPTARQVNLDVTSQVSRKVF